MRIMVRLQLSGRPLLALPLRRVPMVSAAAQTTAQATKATSTARPTGAGAVAATTLLSIPAPATRRAAPPTRPPAVPIATTSFWIPILPASTATVPLASSPQAATTCAGVLAR